MRGEHNMPIIGQGGIETAHDALEFMIAGATTVGLGTALFYDPLAPRKVNAGLDEYLRKCAATCDLRARRRRRNGQDRESGRGRLTQ